LNIKDHLWEETLDKETGVVIQDREIGEVTLDKVDGETRETKAKEIGEEIKDGVETKDKVVGEVVVTTIITIKDKEDGEDIKDGDLWISH
jgi:hypothetical protein